MTDPFEALRMPVTPVAPDPSFTTTLRARIERALTLPRGVAVSTTVIETEPRTTGAAIPYLAVRDARAALDWYVDVLGARLQGEPIVMPDGRIGHAELELAGGLLYLSEEHPEIGVVAPTPGESTVSLMLAVHAADAVRAAVLAAGGSGDREPYDGYGQRNAWVVDPFGHRWGLHSPLPAAAPAYRPGDIGYASLWVPDADRAAEFYSAVLGWTYRVPGTGNSRQVEGATPPQGIWGGQKRGTLFCCYAVADIRAAIERVRDAGGSAEEPTDEPYGPTANCVDDQGVPFALFESPASGGSAPPPSGARHGDLSYVTMLVADSARARAFYGEVLGWTFTGGHVSDGWNVEGIAPMAGMAGGNPEPTGVPMWRVDDVTAAVQRVRDAGGTSTEPQRQPYGVTAECTDDQGTRFYLGEIPAGT